jgi:hypothetical protein
MITSRRMRWARHIACIWEKRNGGLWWEKQKERDRQEDQNIGGRVILK